MTDIILLIDDDEDDCEIFQEAISDSCPSAQLVIASDGVEAIEILNSGKVRPDVIFLDFNLPKMNGFDCLHLLKIDPGTKMIPIVMYSTSGERKQEETALRLGADYYLQKKPGFRQLCGDLKKLLALMDEKKTGRKTL